MQFVSHIQDFLPIRLGLRALIGTSVAIGAATAAVANPASIDTSFADSGWLVLPNSTSGVDALVRLNDSSDHFLAVTQSQNPIQISAFDGDGNPVLSFGNAGVLEPTSNIGLFVDLIRMPDNTFRLVGRERVMAFDASGIALAGFNGDGQLSFDKSITAATVNQGALYLARGVVDAATDAPLIEVEKRSGSTGALDSTFGVGGIATMRSFASNFDAARFIRIDSSGRPVVFGHIVADRQLTVARMTATGAPDTSFGPDGNGLIRDTSGRSRLVDDFEIVDGRLIGSGRFGAGIYEVLNNGSGFEGRVVNTQIGTCIPRDIVPLAGGGLLSVGYDESVADGPDSQICILSIDSNFSIDNNFTSYSANASGAYPTYDYFDEDEEAMSALVLPSGRIVIGAARRAASEMHFSSTAPGKILLLTGPAPDYGADPDDLPTDPTPSPNPAPTTEPGTPVTPAAESSGSGALPLWILLLGVLLSGRKYRNQDKSSAFLMICSAVLILPLTGCATTTPTKSGEEVEAKSFAIDFNAYAYKAHYCSGFLDEPALLHNYLTRTLSPDDFQRYTRLKAGSSPTARAKAADIEAAGREKLRSTLSEVDIDRPYIVYSDWVSLKPIKGKPRHYIFHDTINGSSLNATRKISSAPVDPRLVKDLSLSDYDTVETIAPGGPLGLQQKTYSVEKAIPATRFNVDLTTISGRDRGIWYEAPYKQLVVLVPEDFERDVIQPNLDEGWLTKVKVTIAAAVDTCQPTSRIMKSGFMAIPDIRLYRLSGRVKRIEVHREKTGSWAGAVTSVMKGVRFEGPIIAEWDG